MFGDHPERSDEAAEGPAKAIEEEKPAEVEEEGMMGGMFGIFDGANDAYEPFNRGGGIDSEGQGQWVWHQRKSPHGLHHPIPQPYYPHYPHIPPPPAASSAQFTSHAAPQKRVHFDYGPAGYSQPPVARNSRASYPSDWDRRPTIRPPSRERMRSSERGYTNYSRQSAGPPYPPQQINTKSHDRGQQPQKQQSQRQGGDNEHWQGHHESHQNKFGLQGRGNDNSSWNINNGQNPNHGNDQPHWGYGNGLV